MKGSGQNILLHNPDAQVRVNLLDVDEKLFVTFEIYCRIMKPIFHFSFIPVSVNSKKKYVCAWFWGLYECLRGTPIAVSPILADPDENNCAEQMQGSHPLVRIRALGQSAVVRTAGCSCCDRPELRRLQYCFSPEAQKWCRIGEAAGTTLGLLYRTLRTTKDCPGCLYDLTAVRFPFGQFWTVRKAETLDSLKMVT